MAKVLSDYIMEAIAADDAFGEACKAAGYKSRWDAKVCGRINPALYQAYWAKVYADQRMHEAYER